MDELVAKAAILHEALPYIRRFHNRTFVVKYGGHAMVDESLKQSFARDVCLLRYVGIRVVVVHGGGPQIDEMLQRMGITATFAGGLRVTDDKTMDVVEMVLTGSVNADIVGLICAQGGRAMGLSGRDDNMLLATRVDARPTKNDKGDTVTVDLGRVGKISRVKPELIDNVIQSGFVPVVAPIAVDADGQTLNINADSAAGEIAQAMQAAKLVLMTDVDGVRGTDGQMLPSLSAEQADHLIEQQVIRAGMIPKVECALDAVRNGVEKVHIIDGRTKHALLLEIFTDRGVGTEIHRDGGL